MIKKLIYTLLSLSLLPFISVSAQESGNESSSYPYYYTPEQSQQVTKPTINMQVGTGFGVASGAGSFSNTYIAPCLRYKVSPKFSVTAGATLGYTHLFNYQPYYMAFLPAEAQQQGGFDGSVMSGTFYVQGAYQATDKLKVTGTVFYQQNNMGQISPYLQNGNIQGVDLQLEYKLSDKVTIGGRLMHSSGNISPYGMFGNPYGVGGSQNWGMRPF